MSASLYGTRVDIPALGAMADNSEMPSMGQEIIYKRNRSQTSSIPRERHKRLFRQDGDIECDDEVEEDEDNKDAEDTTDGEDEAEEHEDLEVPSTDRESNEIETGMEDIHEKGGLITVDYEGKSET